MLHQTQADRVNLLLPPFIRRFPAWDSLASASTADVVRAWKGLGYNNRAVRLRELSRIVTVRHHGKLPDNPVALEELPGLGKYSAHAIACFAFGHPVPVVDVNVQRVCSRLFHRCADPLDVRPAARIWEIAAAILPPRTAYDWNQALMEFGAVICRARTPACTECPLAPHCPSRHIHTIRLGRKRNSGRGPEPSFRGIPRRLWRGKIIEALRSLPEGAGVSINKLGALLGTEFHENEIPILRVILARLANDGVLALEQRRGSIRIRLGGTG
jgi:A/G-specific adenine glycosylase